MYWRLIRTLQHPEKKLSLSSLEEISCLLVLLHMKSPLPPSVFPSFQNPVSEIIETGQKNRIPNIRFTKLSVLCRHVHWKFIFRLWYIDHQVQKKRNVTIDSVQSLSHVQLFVTPWITAPQASLSITNSRSLLKFMPIELVMPSNHRIPFSCLQSFPASGSFQISQFFASGGQSTGVAPSASVLLVNIQDWFPLGLIVC